MGVRLGKLDKEVFQPRDLPDRSAEGSRRRDARRGDRHAGLLHQRPRGLRGPAAGELRPGDRGRAGAGAVRMMLREGRGHLAPLLRPCYCTVKLAVALPKIVLLMLAFAVIP